MRFVTFINEHQQPTAGVISDNERVLDLSHSFYQPYRQNTPASIMSFLSDGIDQWAKRIAAWPVHPPALHGINTLRLLAPVPTPSKVIGAAYNFKDALAERNTPTPPEPFIFFRAGHTVIGPNTPILIPSDVNAVGYEGELAVVIGKTAMFVSEQDALDYIGGYIAHNDVSGSGLIKADGGNFIRGKNMPATAPCGPWLATSDEIPDPNNLSIELDIDGKVLQHGNTKDLVFKIPQLISFISHRYPLFPGDIIETGTPAGTAASHTPAAWLAPGQVVTVRVGHLGSLRNPISQGSPFLEH
jgi:2-keto-4-pentenoate hydratase/2-oxohepta-3-ene-1,7-dioic acid hydratase in catechol pathway